jgi:uncharacterized protein YjbJ (UPF0337 family)
MSHVRDKAQGRTKQVIGQMVGDELLVQEGKEQEQAANEPHENEKRRESGRSRNDKQPKR